MFYRHHGFLSVEQEFVSRRSSRLGNAHPFVTPMRTPQESDSRKWGRDIAQVKPIGLAPASIVKRIQSRGNQNERTDGQTDRRIKAAAGYISVVEVKSDGARSVEDQYAKLIYRLRGSRTFGRSVELVQRPDRRRTTSTEGHTRSTVEWSSAARLTGQSP